DEVGDHDLAAEEHLDGHPCDGGKSDRERATPQRQPRLPPLLTTIPGGRTSSARGAPQIDVQAKTACALSDRHDYGTETLPKPRTSHFGTFFRGVVDRRRAQGRSSGISGPPMCGLTHFGWDAPVPDTDTIIVTPIDAGRGSASHGSACEDGAMKARENV